MKYFKISKENYDLRKKQATVRVQGILNYVTVTHTCRSQMLLTYFGEKDAYPCGICDVCIERNKLELSNLEFDSISSEIKALLLQNNMTLESITENIRSVKTEKVLKVVQWLVDNEILAWNDSNQLFLTNKASVINP